MLVDANRDLPVAGVDDESLDPDAELAAAAATLVADAADRGGLTPVVPR